MYKIQVKISNDWVVLESANLDGVSVTKAIEQGHIFARQSVSGAITFTGDDFVTLEAELPTLQQVEAQIYRTEPAAAAVVSGYLNLAGMWDYDRKFCELTFNVVDEYTTILEQWDESLPRSMTESIYDVKILLQSETKTLVITQAGQRPPEEHNWKWTGTIGNEHTYKKQVIYIPVFGWDNDESLPDFGSTMNGDEYLFPVYRFAYSKKSAITQEVEKTIENMINLASYLTNELDQIGITLPANYCPYFDTDGEIDNLMFCRKSLLLNEVLKPSSKRLTVKQILEFYKIAFNLDWYLSGSSLYLIHPSERIFNLPNYSLYPNHRLDRWAEQMQHYTYKSDELPFKELWQVEKTYDADFDGLPIRYTEGISRNQIEYDLTQFQFNIAAVLVAGDADSVRKEDISDDGYCVIACNGLNEIIQKAGIITPENTLINGKLALSRLHQEHHKTGDRYFTTGNMNGETTTFSKIRTRKETMFALPAFITDFNFDYLVETGFGDMRLNSVTEYCNGKFTEIKLEI